MSAPLDLPGMGFDDSLVAYICAHVKATTGEVLHPSDISQASIEHEASYSNGHTDWPERNYISYRVVGVKEWGHIDVKVSTNEFLYDLLRIGLLTTLIPDTRDEA